MTLAFARHGLLALPASVLLAACSPTFDWREARFEGTTLVAMFPCRPDHHARPLELAGRRTTMQMDTCATGGATFALSVVELGDPALAAFPASMLIEHLVISERGAGTTR